MAKVVLANGCFDLFHYGHLLHLEAAKAMGDLLMVSITNDKEVRAEKGEGHPVYDDLQRASIVGALRCVDSVMVVPSLIEAIYITRPDIVVKGIDYRDTFKPEHYAYCKERGIEVRFTETPKYSASEIINQVRK